MSMITPPRALSYEKNNLMKTIVINALNSNSGGGKSIRDSYLRLLNDQELVDRYIVITAKESNLDFVTNPCIEILKMPRYWNLSFLMPLIYLIAFRFLLARIRADIVLNMGDLIVNTNIKQIYIFDWAYALDVHPKVWRDMALPDQLNRRLKLWLIKKYFTKPDVVVALTDHIRDKLRELYGLKDIRVINNAVTISTARSEHKFNFSLPQGVRFVYPSLYYPHKNLEILIELAELIRAKGLDFHIVTTVNPDSHASTKFISSIEEKELQDIVINIGQVPLDNMYELYEQCDALVMPTLLESFSIVYLEAMQHDLPVFTSAMWFAEAVCGEAACYFDPLDPTDILQKIEEVMSDPDAINALIEAGTQQLASFPSWSENFANYQDIITEILHRNSDN